MQGRRATAGSDAWWLGLASIVIQIPFLNRGVSILDEGSILAIADGLRQGEILYSDRITNLGPITFEWMAFLFRILGPHLLIGRILELFIFTCCTLLLHRILADFAPAPWPRLGAIAFLAVKPLAFPFWTEINYSQVGMLFSLVAILATHRSLVSRRLPWLALAGAATGLTILTKQNLGALLALSVSVAFISETGFRRTALRPWALRGGALLAGALSPIAATLVLYQARGGADDLIRRAVLGLVHHVLPFLIPFPGPGIWAFEPEETFRTLAFAFFPPPLVHLIWQGRLGLDSTPTILLIEHAVKATYYLPILALLLGSGGVALRARSGMTAGARSRWLLLLTFVGSSYLTLYRSDWIHLMSISPILILLCTVVLERCSGIRGWCRGVGSALLVLWCSFALIMTTVIFLLYRTPVETPRGRLLGPQPRAELTNRVVEYVKGRPENERILFLPRSPLLYFLTGRRIPIREDVLLPGLMLPEDDARLAVRLADVDRVIYDPSDFPTVRSPITEFAPRTSDRLASDFRVVEVLDRNAVVLEPVPGRPPRGETILDAWTDFERLHPRRWFDRTHWMTYRVIASRLGEGPRWHCFGTRHSAENDERIVAVPMAEPEKWQPGRTPTEKIDFRIKFRAGSEPWTQLFSLMLPARKPAEPIQVPLQALPGGLLELQFCTRLAFGSGPLRAGWGNLRIVRNVPAE